MGPTVHSVELILPAHNEAASIGRTIQGFLEANASAPFELRILVAEDGSSDRTRAVAEELVATSGGRISITPPSGRKGYSKALVDAVPQTTADAVAFCDSDGQFDPHELMRLVERLMPGEVVAGRRSPRRDSRFRILASSAFGLVYRALIGVRMGDPSSPFVVVHREDLIAFLPARTHLSYGFWWEFFARADRAGLRIVEVPVTHRLRSDGKTQVYQARKLPGIVTTHLRGLVRLRRELRSFPLTDRAAR